MIIKRKVILTITITLCLLCLFNTITFAASDFHTFTPSVGGVIYSSSGSNRYAYSYMLWSEAGTSEFNLFNDTYENDLVFYNYDNQAYATKYSTYQSNLPSNYADTQFLDNNNEAVITVGSYKANQIVHDEVYFIDYVLSDYNSPSSMFKVNAQEGYYLVQSPWAVFAQTTNIVIPFKSGFYAPNSSEWRYEEENNGTIATATFSLKNTWSNGTLASSGDVDFWRIFMDGGQKRIRLICPDNCDYDLGVYDSSGNLLTSNFSTLTDSSIYYTFSPNAYYFKIYSYSGSTTTENYRLIIT